MGRLTKSRQNCQVSWSTSPWSPVGSRLLRRLELWGKGRPRIPSGGAPPCSIPSPSLLRCSPATGQSFKGSDSGYLTGASRNAVEILSDEKPSDTKRSRELRLYFMPVVPDELTLKILGPNNELMGSLKGSVGHQVTRNVLVVNR
jgi:hypothetical protein